MLCIGPGMLARMLVPACLAVLVCACLAPQGEETESASGAIEEPDEKGAPPPRKLNLCDSSARLPIEPGTTKVSFEHKIPRGTYASIFLRHDGMMKLSMTVGAQRFVPRPGESEYRYFAAHDGRDGDMPVSFEVTVDPKFGGTVEADGCQPLICSKPGETRMEPPYYGPLIWSDAKNIAAVCPTTPSERQQMSELRDGDAVANYASTRWNWVEKCVAEEGAVLGRVTPGHWQQACVRQ
jgi:hypothetical protein